MAEGSDGGPAAEAARRFIERFALNLTEAGRPRMPARVFAGILIADDGRRTAAELADLLQGQPGGDLRRRAVPDAAPDGGARARARRAA